MTVGAAIALGAAIGLVLGILVAVTTDVPLAPEGGLGARGAGRLALAPKPRGMSDRTAAGISLLTVPILFNATFTLLAQRFDYPDVLRRPTHDVLATRG